MSSLQEQLLKKIMAAKTQFVSDLKDKEPVRASFLIKYSAVAQGKNGKPYMNLVLMDKSGEVEARIFDDAASHANHAVRDAFVFVEGKCQLYQGRKQVHVQKLQVLREDEVQIADYLAESKLDAEALYRSLCEFIGTMKDPHYRALAEAVLIEDATIVEKLKRAPAAKTIHHAYKTGLLEHLVSITRTLDFMSNLHGKWLDRDLLFLGGFFHDIAKIWELSFERVTDYTDEGRLIGHLVMGVELVERKINELDSTAGRLPSPFPMEKRLLVKHLVLAHHGRLEYGSPKVPQCLEALVVAAVDDLDSKINGIGVFIEQDQNPGRWTLLNRQFERYFYKPDWAMKVSP
jgi:3'-5' exoribonuclease